MPKVNPILPYLSCPTREAQLRLLKEAYDAGLNWVNRDLGEALSTFAGWESKNYTYLEISPTDDEHRERDSFRFATPYEITNRLSKGAATRVNSIHQLVSYLARAGIWSRPKTPPQ